MKTTINHPTFGAGTVISVEGMFTVAQFDCGVRRVMNTTNMVQRVAKPVRVRREVVLTPVQELAQVLYATTGVWQADHIELVARIAAKAAEMNNEMIASIAGQLRKSHSITPAQASAMARFANANNITI